MTTTTNLGITLIETNQSQKEVTANEAILALEEAATEWLAVEVEDGANAVSNAAVRENQLLVLTAGSPGPSAAFDVELPALKRMLAIRNDAGYTATIACSGAATGAAESVIEDGKAALVFCTGSEVFTITADQTSLVNAFTDLSDVPSTYYGQGGKFLRVDAGGTAVEFSAGELAINAQTGTTYTLVLSDAGKLVTLDNGSAITLYVPEDSSVDFPVGTQIILAQLDAQVTVAEGATAVTIITPETYALRKAGAQASLVKIAADTWLLEGNLEAA